MEETTIDGVFAERLKRLRAERKLSQAQLSKKINLSQSAVAGWEKCRSEPNCKTLRTVADALDVTLDYLLGRTDNPLSTVQTPAGPYLEVTPFEKGVVERYRRATEGEQVAACRVLGIEHPAEARIRAKRVS